MNLEEVERLVAEHEIAVNAAVCEWLLVADHRCWGSTELPDGTWVCTLYDGEREYTSRTQLTEVSALANVLSIAASYELQPG